ncbi:MAG: PilZ domain-containing protein [Gammaproteobacteria bacterium]|nr:PilZ domain-containing protein [Gammaproteobacteria bacterium]
MSDSDLITESDDERRRYFRIEDSIRLGYQPIDKVELAARQERLGNGDESEFNLMSGIQDISQQTSGLLHKVEARYPDIANYLKAMERKIDMLGRALMAQNTDLSTKSAQAVNISASGIAFLAPDAFEKGDWLELRLMLLPSFTGILSLVEVVACKPEPVPEGEAPCYNLRVDFSYMREGDRDLLIRHVLRRQGEILRRARELQDAK